MQSNVDRHRTFSLEDFRSQYRQQKPYFEYWFGEPIQQTMPDWLHAWEPVPDVIATLKSIQDNPTEPVEIVVEILSVALEEIWRQLEEQA